MRRLVLAFLLGCGAAEVDSIADTCEPYAPFPMTMVGCTEASQSCGDGKAWECESGLVVKGCCDGGPLASGRELWCCQ